MSAMEIEVFTEAPAPEPRRPRVLLVGTAIAAGAAAMVVLGLVALYLNMRAEVIASGETWLPEETNLPLTPGNMGAFTLALSAVTAQWARYSLRNDDRPHAYLALGITVLLGVAFINGTAFAWQELGLGIDDSPQALLIYTITGLHVAMVAVALAFFTVMAFRAFGGQLTARATEGVDAAALFWYVTLAVYGVIWFAIYITK